MNDLMAGLSKYFVFYNGERPHQVLENSSTEELEPKEGEKATSGQGCLDVIEVQGTA